jgi:hypothetical protein
MISIISETVISFPDISIAFVGQTSAHFPHEVQRSELVIIPSGANVIAFSGQAATHDPHLIHFAGAYIFSTFDDMLSGL